MNYPTLLKGGVSEDPPQDGAFDASFSQVAVKLKGYQVELFYRHLRTLISNAPEIKCIDLPLALTNNQAITVNKCYSLMNRSPPTRSENPWVRHLLPSPKTMYPSPQQYLIKLQPKICGIESVV